MDVAKAFQPGPQIGLPDGRHFTANLAVDGKMAVF